MDRSLLQGWRGAFAALVVALAAAGCGGGEPQAEVKATTPQAALGALKAKAKPQAAALVTTQQMAEQFFTLAETYYPGLFVGHPETFAYYGFYLRYYASTGIYLGVVYDGNYGFTASGVYGLGGPFGNNVYYGGVLADFGIQAPAGPLVPVLTVGAQPFTIVYSGGTKIGIDSRSTTNITFDGSNAMTGYNYSGNEAPTIGTMSIADLEGTAAAQIGRWNNGTFAGKFYNDVDESHTLSFTANQGFHYGIASVPDKIPCGGSTTYHLASNTAPTIGDGSVAPGNVAQISLTVTFNGASNPSFNLVGGFAMPGGPQLNFSGTSTNYNAGWRSFYVFPAAPGPGFGTANVQGAFAGRDASEVVLAFSGFAAGNNPAKGTYFTARLVQASSSATACP